MKEFSAVGRHVEIGALKKRLSCQNNANCEVLCFTLDRFSDGTDLSQCSCSIKTKNSVGKSDVILPASEIGENQIRVLWTLTSASTSAAGMLQAQIQFEKIFSDASRNIVWQSEIMEFEISESLASADEIYDQNPTLFQQWEDKMNAAQTAAQTAASLSAADAQEAAVQAAAAKACADSAKQTVEGFTGYTRQECDVRFAAALTGSAQGQPLKLDDVQAGTAFSSLLVTGGTSAAGSGERSPDNPYSLAGADTVAVTDGALQTAAYPIKQMLYSIPDGTADTCDLISGVLTQRVAKVVLDGSQPNILFFTTPAAGYSSFKYNTGTFYTPTSGSKAGRVLCDKLKESTAICAGEWIFGANSWFGMNSFGFTLSDSRLGIVSADTAAQKAQKAKTWLAANPLTVLYELTTPVPIAAGALSVPAYAPVCILSCPNAVLKVFYSRDGNKVIQKLEAAVAALKA